MKRLYFLIPDVECTKKVVMELKEQGIEDRDIHVVGTAHHEMEEAHIHEASALQTSDVIHSMQVGAMSGIIIGALTGLFIMSMQPAGLDFGYAIVLGLGIFGALFGAWVSSMIGISVPSPIVQKYQDEIDKGHLLMMVDVKVTVANEMIEAIKSHHPEVEVKETKITQIKGKPKSA